MGKGWHFCVHGIIGNAGVWVAKCKRDRRTYSELFGGSLFACEMWEHRWCCHSFGRLMPGLNLNLSTPRRFRSQTSTSKYFHLVFKVPLSTFFSSGQTTFSLLGVLSCKKRRPFIPVLSPVHSRPSTSSSLALLRCPPTSTNYTFLRKLPLLFLSRSDLSTRWLVAARVICIAAKFAHQPTSGLIKRNCSFSMITISLAITTRELAWYCAHDQL